MAEVKLGLCWNSMSQWYLCWSNYTCQTCGVTSQHPWDNAQKDVLTGQKIVLTGPKDAGSPCVVAKICNVFNIHRVLLASCRCYSHLIRWKAPEGVSTLPCRVEVHLELWGLVDQSPDPAISSWIHRDCSGISLDIQCSSTTVSMGMCDQAASLPIETIRESM